MAKEQPTSLLRFDWLISGLSLWMVSGFTLDAWAHHQFEVETFFMPWHGVLYSGFLLLTIVLVSVFIRNLRQAYAWRRAMPVGYDLSLWGVLIFMVGGVGDMLWHLFFGIEVDLEALLSPTHLLLAFGGVLILTGPIRAAWAPSEAKVASWPALLSLALLLSVFSFFTSYANPLSHLEVVQGQPPVGETDIFLTQGVGVAGILIQSALITSICLLAVRRWILSFGSLTLILGTAGLLTVSVHENFQLLPPIVLAGLLADLLLKRWQPSTARPAALRNFALALPVIFYSLYFATLALTSGIWWRVHLWAGAIVMSGIVGWLLSYIFIPPAPSGEQGLTQPD